MKTKAVSLVKNPLLPSFLITLGVLIAYLLQEYRATYAIALVLLVVSLIRDEKRKQHAWFYAIATIGLFGFIYLLSHW